MNFRKEGFLVIGLSGGIASGKSTALKTFEKLGAEVICSDTLAAKNFALLKDKIETYFKTADKAKLAGKIFKNGGWSSRTRSISFLVFPLRVFLD